MAALRPQPRLGRARRLAVLAGALLVALLSWFGLLSGGRPHLYRWSQSFVAFEGGRVNSLIWVDIDVGERVHDPLTFVLPHAHGEPQQWLAVDEYGRRIPEMEGPVVVPGDGESTVAVGQRFDGRRTFTELVWFEDGPGVGDRWQFTALVAHPTLDADEGVVVLKGLDLADVECVVEGAPDAVCERTVSNGYLRLTIAPLPAGSRVRVAGTVVAFVDDFATDGLSFEESAATPAWLRAAVGGALACVSGALVARWLARRRRRVVDAQPPAEVDLEHLASTATPPWVAAAIWRGIVDDTVVDAWAADAVTDGALVERADGLSLGRGPAFDRLEPAARSVLAATVPAGPDGSAGPDELRWSWYRMRAVLQHDGRRQGWWRCPTRGSMASVGGAGVAAAAFAWWLVESGWSNDWIVGFALAVVLPVLVVAATEVLVEPRLTPAGLAAAGEVVTMQQILSGADAALAHRVAAADGAAARVMALAVGLGVPGRWLAAVAGSDAGDEAVHATQRALAPSRITRVRAAADAEADRVPSLWASLRGEG